MKIQWFPGHMHKARQKMLDILPRVDLLLEILDARIPHSTSNPMLEEMRGSKPVITILARDDLADPAVTSIWLSVLAERRLEVIALSLKAPGACEVIPRICRQTMPGRSGAPGGIRVLVAGIPNVGKSTLINAMAGRKVARTGNEPAVTKHQQHVAVGEGLQLFDTPGVLWPNVENRHSGYRLALTGAIRETAFDETDVAAYGVAYMLKVYPERLRERYELDELPAEPVDFLDAIGRRRGSLVRGGVVDLHRVSRVFLNELRSGMLGRLSFETPEMIDEELRVVEVERAKKEARVAARKKRKR